MGGRCESCPFDTLIITARGLAVCLTHHRALPPGQGHAIRPGSAAADRPHSKIMLSFDGGSTPTFKTPMSTGPSRAAAGLSSTSLSDHSHTSIGMTHPVSTAPSPASPMNSTPSPPTCSATHALSASDSRPDQISTQGHPPPTPGGLGIGDEHLGAIKNRRSSLCSCERVRLDNFAEWETV